MLLGPLRGGLDALPRPRRDDHRTRIAGRRKHSLDGLGPAVRRQGEETPVHGQHHRAPHTTGVLHGLLGTEMQIWPRLVVLPDLDHGEMERAEPITNRSQARKEPGISRVVDPMPRTYE